MSKNEPISRLGSPLRLFFSLLLVIFSIETLIMFIALPMLFGGCEGFGANIADSFLLAMLAAPFLWIRIVRPLRNAALQEAAWTRTVLEQVVDGVVVLNKEGVVESANASAEAMFGYTCHEVTGLEMKNLLPEGDFPADKAQITRDQIQETFGRRKDGSLFPMDLSISEARVDDGLMLICIMRDITERKRAEKAIRQLNEELAEKMNELLAVQEKLVQKERFAMLGRIAEGLGNELRNPLGVMNNAVFFLKGALNRADETVGEYLGIIKNEIDNSQRILSDLVDFVSAKPPRLRVAPVHDLLGHSLEGCTIPEGVELRVELPETLPPLQVDPQHMERVLRNLVTNAVQAMPQGGALRIAAKRVKAAGSALHDCPVSGDRPGSPGQETGDFIEISVEDTGDGIAPEDMGSVFQPLFTTKARGIGLGLPICKNLVEANGGRIGVASELGKGTTFTMILPAGSDV